MTMQPTISQLVGLLEGDNGPAVGNNFATLRKGTVISVGETTCEVSLAGAILPSVPFLFGPPTIGICWLLSQPPLLFVIGTGGSQGTLPSTGTDGAPTTGTWVKDTVAVSLLNALWICIVSGSPGDWEEVTSGGTSGVTSFDTRTGDVSLLFSDVETLFEAAGELIVGTGTGTAELLPPGTSGDVLVAPMGNPSDLEWYPLLLAIEALFTLKGQVFYGTGSGTGGLTNLLTAIEDQFTVAGQLIVGTGLGSGELLTPGASGYGLVGNGVSSVPSWQAIVNSFNGNTGAITVAQVLAAVEAGFTAANQIIMGTSSGHGELISLLSAIEGLFTANGQILYGTGGGTGGLTNLLTALGYQFTAAGQLIVGTGSTTAELLAAGTSKYALVSNGPSTVPSWQAIVNSLLAGTGISVSQSSGVWTVTNTGVTSLAASTGISVSGSTGAVTIANTGVTSLTGGTGINVSGSTGSVTISTKTFTLAQVEAIFTAIGQLLVGTSSGNAELLSPGAANTVLTSNGPSAVPSWQPSSGSGPSWFNAIAYGCDPTGATDSSAAIQAMLNDAVAAGVGNLYFPRNPAGGVGIYRCNAQLYLPITNIASTSGTGPNPMSPYTVYTAPPIHIFGDGAPDFPRGDTSLAMGSILEFGATSFPVTVTTWRGETATPFIVGLGEGRLEIDHIQLRDATSGHNFFVFVNNTVLKLHDVTAVGNASLTSAQTDLVLLGAYTSSFEPSGGAASPAFPNPGTYAASLFQGYGTHIHDCTMVQMRRLAVLQDAANVVKIDSNANYYQCGFSSSGIPSYGSNGAIVEMAGHANSVYAAIVEDNDFEGIGGYVYGVGLFAATATQSFFRNAFSDASSPYFADYYLAPGVNNNTFMALSASSNPFAIAAPYAENTFLGFAESASIPTSLIPIGGIILWGGSTGNIPWGFFLCDGAGFGTTTYPTVFAKIGYTFGGSGGTFNVPNMPAPVANTYYLMRAV
jgi:hypothetical protein